MNDILIGLRGTPSKEKKKYSFIQHTRFQALIIQLTLLLQPLTLLTFSQTKQLNPNVSFWQTFRMPSSSSE